MLNLELNLPRWIYASAAKAFNANVNTKIPIYYEGQDRQTQKESDFFEFRLDGPFVNKTTATDYFVDVEINILVVSQIDAKDTQKIYKNCGVALQYFTNAIPIYKYGDGPSDDGTLLACMNLVRPRDQRDYVRVAHFGRLDPNKPVLQASVEGHYHFFVTGK